MISRNVFGFMMAVVLIILLLVSAGCTAIPGPEPRTTLRSTTTFTPQETVTIKTMGVSTTVMTIVPTAVVTTTPANGVPAPATTGQGMYETRTCAQQGGGIALPGQKCPGAWLIAGDTFSCCSTSPVRATARNTSVTIDPFVLAIVMDDDPGSVLP
jgi:hypothetical protein